MHDHMFGTFMCVCVCIYTCHIQSATPWFLHKVLIAYIIEIYITRFLVAVVVEVENSRELGRAHIYSSRRLAGASLPPIVVD